MSDSIILDPEFKELLCRMLITEPGKQLSKLTPSEIMNMFKHGMSFREIGGYAGMSARHVRKIVETDIRLTRRVLKRVEVMRKEANP